MSVSEHFLLNKVNRRVTAHEITNELEMSSISQPTYAYIIIKSVEKWICKSLISLETKNKIYFFSISIFKMIKTYIIYNSLRYWLTLRRKWSTEKKNQLQCNLLTKNQASETGNLLKRKQLWHYYPEETCWLEISSLKPADMKHRWPRKQSFLS